jgi:hypothetical protein
MRREEQIARTYLLTLGLGDPAYEPDGQMPPDFSLHNQIGVEVRRLNQVIRVDGKYQGTEQLSIALWNAFTEVLGSFNALYSGKSYWVGIDFHNSFSRPTKTIKSQMRRTLESFLQKGTAPPCRLGVNDAIGLSVYESQPLEGRLFRPAGSMNYDEGGAVLQMYAFNINRFIAEKTAKVAAHKSRYETWWLVLVDNLGWGLSQHELQELKKSLKDLGCFQRLYIIDRDAELLLDVSQ